MSHADGRRVLLLGTAQGLVAEADAVERLLRREPPAVVAIQVDPEDASGVARWPATTPDAPEDELYLEHLAAFGEVELPAPDLRRAAAVAPGIGAALVGIDVPEAAWVDEFTRRVSGLDLVRRGLRVRRGTRRLRRCTTPEEVCDVFDAHANRGPYRGLEAWREREMAARIAAAASTGPLVGIVEAARFAGVAQALGAEGFSPAQ